MFSSQVRFAVRRLRERLWIRPLVVCLLSIAGAFVAKFADGTGLADLVPEITAESIQTLLSIMAASMLVIATFAVGSMVAAYASAGASATPRAFALVVADDGSQNALSTFLGAFIFAVVALTVLKNDYFGAAGRFTLFVLTALVFGIVIVTFVTWVDSIARLGRVTSTIARAERAALAATSCRRQAPRLRGMPVDPTLPCPHPVFATSIGFVQRIDMEALQAWAVAADAQLQVAALPGTFAAPGRPLVWTSVSPESGGDTQPLASAFGIGRERMFDDDPRFGLVVLAEISGRALSSAVNDPGTAIVIIGSLVRVFAAWVEPMEGAPAAPQFDRVHVPELSFDDMTDDAFTSISRDGAGTVEVMVRLMKALSALTALGDPALTDAARRHARTGLARAEGAMQIPEDVDAVRALAANV